MKCVKCGYNLGDPAPNYCPNCGKKAKIDVVKSTGLQNIDFLRLADLKRFKEDWPSVTGLDPESVFLWMHSPHEPAFVYSITANFIYYARNYEGDLLRKEEREFTRVCRSDMEMLMRGYPRDDIEHIRYSNVNFSATKTPLKPSMSPNKMGENWWWEESDCQAVIDDVLRNFGGEEQKPE